MNECMAREDYFSHKDGFPINGKASLFVHFFLFVHCFIRSWISLKLGCGRPSDILSEFISVPKM